MKRLQPHALRLGTEKRGVANRSDDPLNSENFLKEWRRLLTREGAAWDGERAARELKEKEVFQFLNYQPKDEHPDNRNWNADILFDEILGEMKRYRQDATNRLTKDYFDEIDEHLIEEIEWTEERMKAIPLHDIKVFLRNLKIECINARNVLEKVKKRRIEWPFGLLNRIQTTAPIHNIVNRNIELDSRLQVKLGQLFGSYLFKEGVSVETILRTTYTNRKLQRRNIRDALDGKGVKKELFDV
jgi:hypothetical protein